MTGWVMQQNSAQAPRSARPRRYNSLLNVNEAISLKRWLQRSLHQKPDALRQPDTLYRLGKPDRKVL
jgi:hypothetical protein